MSAVAKFICWTNTPPPPPAANTNTQIHKSTFSLELQIQIHKYTNPPSLSSCKYKYTNTQIHLLSPAAPRLLMSVVASLHPSLLLPFWNLWTIIQYILPSNKPLHLWIQGRFIGKLSSLFLDCALKDETILVARWTLRVNGLRRVHCTLGSLHQMNRFTWSELDQYVRSWKEALYYLHKKQIVGEVIKCVLDFLGFFLSFVSSIPFFALSRVFSAR